MKKLVTIALCLASFSAFSARTQLGVVDILEPTVEGEGYVLFADDGLVYDIAVDDTETVENAFMALELGVKVSVKLEDSYNATDLLALRNTIEKVKILSEETDAKLAQEREGLDKDLGSAELMSSYVTDFDDENTVRRLFNTMRTDTRTKSQCFNRAHVWSWELHARRYKGQRIQTGKIWLFFSKKYIRQYNYKWWFHIAPYLNVKGEMRVIDRSFSYKPLAKKSWTDMFMQNRADCPNITKYSDYRDYPYDYYCYTMKSSVFYWQPWQLENVETKGEGKENWVPYELKKAYRNAIGFFSRDPELSN